MNVNRINSTCQSKNPQFGASRMSLVAEKKLLAPCETYLPRSVRGIIAEKLLQIGDNWSKILTPKNDLILTKTEASGLDEVIANCNPTIIANRVAALIRKSTPSNLRIGFELPREGTLFEAIKRTRPNIPDENVVVHFVSARDALLDEIAEGKLYQPDGIDSFIPTIPTIHPAELRA